MIKELGIDEAVKIRCTLIKRLIEANQNTLNSSRLTFAKATFRLEVLIFQKVKFKHGLMSLTQYKELVKTILEPDDLTKLLLLQTIQHKESTMTCSKTLRII